MMIVWGSKLYGRVDKVDGLGLIATEFGHLFWIPLIPKHSYFVLSENRHSHESIQIPLSNKSVLAGYGFAASVVCILMAIGSMGALNDPQHVIEPGTLPIYYAFMVLGAMAVPLLLWLQTKKFRTANYETACQMAALTGDDRVQVFVDHRFGKLSDEEADQRIEALEQVGQTPPEYSMPQDAAVPIYDAHAASAGY